MFILGSLHFEVQLEMKYNYYWWLMYKLFKKRRPIPKNLLDFDEIHTISDVVKEEFQE